MGPPWLGFLHLLSFLASSLFSLLSVPASWRQCCFIVHRNAVPRGQESEKMCSLTSEIDDL